MLFRSVILNFLLFRMNYGYAQQINGVFWTLVVEFQFYLLLPLIAWIISLVVRRGSVRWRLTKLTLCLLAMISWGAITRYWALNIVDTTRLDWLIPRSIEVTLRDFLYGNPAYDASGRYFEVFGIGMLLCMFYVYSRNVPHTARWNRIIQHLSLIFAFLGLSSSVFLAIWNLYSLNVGAGPTLQYIFHSYESFWANTWPAFHPFLSGVSYGLCIFALLHGPAWIKRPFEVSPLRWIGAISYSLYMWHLPLAYLFLGYSFSFMHGRSIIVQYTISSLWVLIVVFPF